MSQDIPWIPVLERLPTESDGYVEMLLKEGSEKTLICRWDLADGSNVEAWRPKQ